MSTFFKTTFMGFFLLASLLQAAGLPADRGVASCGFTAGFGAPTPDGYVWDSTVADLGDGPALYVAGSFKTIDGIQVNGVAKWDGAAWSPLGSGILGGSRWNIASYNDGSGTAIYLFGDFSSVGGVEVPGGVAKWDGSTWQDTGIPAPEGKWDGYSYNDGSGEKLFVSGFTNFEETDEVVATWDGSQLRATGFFGLFGNDPPRAFAAYDDGNGTALYAAGDFESDTLGTFKLAKWDGSTWTPISTDLQGEPKSLTVFDDGNGPALFIGGEQLWSTGSPPGTRYPLARWDGTLSMVGGPFTGRRSAELKVFDAGAGPELYVMGDFTQIGGVSAKGIAKWNGKTWSALQTGIDTDEYSDIATMTVFDDGNGPDLYVGSFFRWTGSAGASYLARWNGTAWSRVSSAQPGNGVNQTVRAFVTWDDGQGEALYVGGDFVNPANTGSRYIARWDGSAWHPLGVGPSGRVDALAVFDDGSGAALYAAGLFQRADGIETQNIARWTGTAWQALPGGGLNGHVKALATHNDGSGNALYASGDFTEAGGTPAVRMAKWDGSTWSSAGTFSLEANVLLEWDDGDGNALYFANQFWVGRYKNGVWSTLGENFFPGPVLSLAVYSGSLYAGGDFAIPGPGYKMAKWDGIAWVAVGELSREVYDLKTFDDGTGEKLYAAGVFHSIDGQAIAGVASWDGSQWRDVGPGGLQGGAFPCCAERFTGGRALGVFDTPSGSSLFVGGMFSFAGGLVSSNIGEYACTYTNLFGDGFESGSLDAWSSIVP